MQKIIDKDDNHSEEEKLKAAYVLNMCAVSISQIVDYNDLYILEQEYDMILNNLNLKQMPKDEALLNIITEILNTISFFRIQDIKKAQIEKKYQQRLNSAIWSAVPSLNVLVTGNPAVVALSLATQIGTGYMNYRKEKALALNDKEDAELELRITAIEQFNALKRELFTATWRLADEYDFNDEWRITEKQIKRYNEILMDSNNHRKLLRLESLSNQFNAYPPFWYFYANTANKLYHSNDIGVSDEQNESFKQKALFGYKKYNELNRYNILREDQIASTCLLEYADLLLENSADYNVIEDLLQEVEIKARNDFDILQLCAFSYIKIGMINKASNIFSYLVNEEYNSRFNSQLLSGIYVNDYINNHSVSSFDSYKILSSLVDSRFLYTMPDLNDKISMDEAESSFIEEQKLLLEDRFDAVIDSVLDKYSIKFSKLFPPFDEKTAYHDNYYLQENFDQRIDDLTELFENKFKRVLLDNFISQLSQKDFILEYLKTVNSFVYELLDLNFNHNNPKLIGIVRKQLSKTKNNFESFYDHIYNNDNNEYDLDIIIKIYKYCTPYLYNKFIDNIKLQIAERVVDYESYNDVMNAEIQLQSFCEKYDIKFNDNLIINNYKYNDYMELESGDLGIDIFDDLSDKMKKRIALFGEIESILRKNDKYFNNQKDKVLLFNNDKLFDSYLINDSNKKGIIAIFDDQTKTNIDILFTIDGIIVVVDNEKSGIIPYESCLIDIPNKHSIEDIVKASNNKEKFRSIITEKKSKVSRIIKSLSKSQKDDEYLLSFIESIQNVVLEICDIKNK